MIGTKNISKNSLHSPCTVYLTPPLLHRLSYTASKKYFTKKKFHKKFSQNFFTKLFHKTFLQKYFYTSQKYFPHIKKIFLHITKNFHKNILQSQKNFPPFKIFFLCLLGRLNISLSFSKIDAYNYFCGFV